MRFLKIFDPIFKRRLKRFYFSSGQKKTIEKSFLSLDECMDDKILLTYHYSNILNVMIAKNSSFSTTQLRIGVQDLLNDHRKMVSICYEIILWFYSIYFFRKIFFKKIQLYCSFLESPSIIRASQSGFLFINPKSLTIKSVWLIGNLELAYTVKNDWNDIFRTLHSTTVLKRDKAFCEECLIIGESMARLNSQVKASFIRQYRNELDRELISCSWVRFDRYLECRIAQLPDQFKNFLGNFCYSERSDLIPILPQHGDFQFGNIVVSSEKTIVIDWEAAFHGFALYDFFVLTSDFRTSKFWEVFRFEDLCLQVKEADFIDLDARLISILLLIEEYIYRTSKFACSAPNSNIDRLILSKISRVFRIEYENIIH